MELVANLFRAGFRLRIQTISDFKYRFQIRISDDFRFKYRFHIPIGNSGDVKYEPGLMKLASELACETGL